MATDGTWAADLAALARARGACSPPSPDSGSGEGKALVLSRTVTVPGAEKKTPLPSAASSTAVDGYTVAVTSSPIWTLTPT